jgi:hypothetical protein
LKKPNCFNSKFATVRYRCRPKLAEGGDCDVWRLVATQ